VVDVRRRGSVLDEVLPVGQLRLVGVLYAHAGGGDRRCELFWEQLAQRGVLLCGEERLLWFA
jgi:hypothetical protein